MNHHRTHPTGSPARRSEWVLLLLFLLGLPFLNPWVRGDGVGYYAFARAPLIQHNLDFAPDYQHANASFREPRLDAYGQPREAYRTSTGHLDNHFSIGPAILWSPFLIAAHGGVLLARFFGSSVAADGFSTPYRLAMAFATALYGFLALLFAFRIARKYAGPPWAFLATLAVWGSTSLPVYMYFNPSWSHAHSAFAVSLFFWYWLETRENRSLPQWIVLGAIVGLMLNVYYANALLLLVLVPEAVSAYVSLLRGRSPHPFSFRLLLARHLLFALAVVVCLIPTFITRAIVYGSPFESGYIPMSHWLWGSPCLLQVLFSSNHGLFSWTPLVALSFLGLLFFWRQVPRIGGPALLGVLGFYWFIASYPDWDGIASFGNRFFISLTVFFVLGLAVLLHRVAARFHNRSWALSVCAAVLACFLAWNLGLIFQWGSHLIPVRGPVAWSDVVHNQFFVVPRRLSSSLSDYFLHRRDLMKRIEQRDSEQRSKQPLP
jgi:hypothetical protein